MHHRIALVENTGTSVKCIALKDMKRKMHQVVTTCVKQMENGVGRKQFVFSKIVEL